MSKKQRRRKMCVWKRKENKESKKGMRRDESSEDQMKWKEGCHIVKRWILYSSNHVQSDNEEIIGASEYYFLLPFTCPPFYIFLSLTPSHHGLVLMTIGLKGKRPSEEFLSLTIFV
jgi:hypothetical protein